MTERRSGARAAQRPGTRHRSHAPVFDQTEMSSERTFSLVRLYAPKNDRKLPNRYLIKLVSRRQRL